jgi:hypothetical protein
MRLTIACPLSFADDANQLARCLGLGPNDDRTFGAASWLDAAGNAYACSSQEVAENWLDLAQAPLAMPQWGCDLAAAGRAQAALALWPAAATDEGQQIAPTHIWIAADTAPGAVLAAMGLAQPDVDF